MPGAAPTRVDLRLDHRDRRVQGAGGINGFRGGGGGTSFRHGHAVGAQKRLCLIFVNIHLATQSVVLIGGVGLRP